MRKSLVLLILLGASATGQARDIYVDNMIGDDRRSGASPNSAGSEGGPVLTIEKAIRLSSGGGDRIVLAATAQPYREMVALQGPRCSGTSVRPFQLIGNGAVIDGRTPLGEDKWESVRDDLFRTQPAYMSRQQLFLGESLLERRTAAPGVVPELKPLQWALLDGWIYFRAEPDRLPGSYELSCCGGTTGITLYNVHDAIVTDVIVLGFALDGVNAHDNVRQTDLIGVESRNNGRSGFSIGGASRVQIDGCAASGNAIAQIRTEGFSVTQVISGDFDTTSAPLILSEGGRIQQVEAP